MDPTRVQETLSPIYDYIIVGAGSSGCVVANRLSEDRNTTVLILEAGGDDRQFPDIAVPRRAGHLTDKAYEWGFTLNPQENAFKGYENQAYPLLSGRVLGGSSAINYMMYMRGTPHDFDTWKNMGCTGWGYTDVLPYFIKSESCLTKRLRHSGVRGTSGPVMVSEVKFSPLSDICIQGGKAMGYPETDCNGTNPIGFMTVETNTGDGIRQSSAESYLRPASTRPNLHIATYAHVNKVLITEREARGVEFYHRDTLRTVRARREVVLCAGAYCSPKILLLSGVGPRQHLRDVGVDVIRELPVGGNLQYHTAVVGLEVVVDTPLDNRETVGKLYREQRTEHIVSGSFRSAAMIRTKHQHPANPNPDLLLMILSGLTGSQKPRHMAAMKGEIFDAIYKKNEGKDGFDVSMFQCHGRSRGSVRLRSTDPRATPVIDHQCFTHAEDLDTLVEGIKFVLGLINTEPFRAVGARYADCVLPGYSGAPYTDDYWREYVRTMTHNFHPAGTCRMGRAEDPTAVVDSQLRVKGIERLRVADASIMPEITSTNLNATCVMIGEKAADLIKHGATAFL